MPRHPVLRPVGVPVSYAGELRERARRSDAYAFWLGDPCHEPPDVARLSTLELERPEHYRYGPPRGDEALIAAIAAKLARKNRITAAASQLIVTAGATHALDCAMRAVIEPGDEVLVLSPHWPVVRGQVLAAGGRPVEVEFSSQLLRDPALDPAELLERHVGPRTTAVYVATPNNPDGKVLGTRELAAIRDVAIRHDLWIFADEVYEDCVFDGELLSIATLDGAGPRTFTIYSLSKSYALPGLRIGYLVSPPVAAARAAALALHSVFNLPLVLQRAARQALELGEPFLAAARTEYREARDIAVERLARFGARTPEGGIYLFLDLRRFTRPGQRVLDFLGELADRGLLLAHGTAFGEAYADWARLCFAALPRPRLEAGLDELVRALDEREHELRR